MSDKKTITHDEFKALNQGDPLSDVPPGFYDESSRAQRGRFPTQVSPVFNEAIRGAKPFDPEAKEPLSREADVQPTRIRLGAWLGNPHDPDVWDPTSGKNGTKGVL